MTVQPDGSKTVNLVAFEEFCRAHPQLIRRIKEMRIPVDGSEERAHPLAATPTAIVAFLRTNRKVPSRYKPGTRELHKERLKQFPVLPDLRNQRIPTTELDVEAELADHEQDAFLASPPGTRWRTPLCRRPRKGRATTAPTIQTRSSTEFQNGQRRSFSGTGQCERNRTRPNG